MTEYQANHIPVLLNETMVALAIRVDGVYIDGTFGRGGHARQILSRLSDKGLLLGLDHDPQAVAEGYDLAQHDTRFAIEQCSFAHLAQPVNTRNWHGKVDGVLLDIGLSSSQLDDPSRGFSFQKEGPLDMRMNPKSGVSAAEWLAKATVDDIAFVIKTFGEERFAKRIAKAIIKARQHKPILSTTQLATLVGNAMPFRQKHKHPATRTFQAIRIYINDELNNLKKGLQQALDVLAIGGRLVVITFHSLEDRIVKHFFRHQASGDDFPVNFPVTADKIKPNVRLIAKPIRASDDEIAFNTRSRSATLRVVEKAA